MYSGPTEDPREVLRCVRPCKPLKDYGCHLGVHVLQLKIGCISRFRGLGCQIDNVCQCCLECHSVWPIWVHLLQLPYHAERLPACASSRPQSGPSLLRQQVMKLQVDEQPCQVKHRREHAANLRSRALAKVSMSDWKAAMLGLLMGSRTDVSSVSPNSP